MTDRYDACIVGAGISGLNALFVASQYLARDQRVIDREHHRRALEKITERFGVHCGPVVGAGRTLGD